MAIIFHNFSGRFFDQYGNTLQYVNSQKKYNDMKTCLIEQYGGYSIPEVSNFTVNESLSNYLFGYFLISFFPLQSQIDGTLTLDENIADNGGLQAAFLAFKVFKAKTGTGQRLPGLERFTDEQLFFISFGNVGQKVHVRDVCFFQLHLICRASVR
jgi:predicted metalloendopeptidase